MKELERTLKALANKRRLAILKFLKSEKEAFVSAIAKEIQLSFKSTSRHLSVLINAEILEKDQRSTNVYYRLGSSLHPSAKHTISLL